MTEFMWFLEVFYQTNLKTIGREKVAVPNYFYKVLLTKDRKRMIGFLVAHKTQKSLCMSLLLRWTQLKNSLEIDFFPELEDAIEAELEKSTDYKKWSF